MSSDPKGPKGPQKTIFGYAAPDMPQPGAPQAGQPPAHHQGQGMGGMPPSPAAPQGGTGHQPNEAWGQPQGQQQWGQQQGQPQQQWGQQQGQPQQQWGQQQGQPQQQWGQQQGQPQEQQWGQQQGQPQQQWGQQPGQQAQQGWDHGQQQQWGQQQGQPQQQQWGQQQGQPQQQQWGQQQGQQAWDQGQQAQQQQWGQQQAQPQAQQGWGGGAQDPLGDLAGKLPQSKPGTLFGVDLAILSDASFQRKVLLFCGIGLVIAAFTPLSLSPFVGSWAANQTFRLLIWPLVAGGAYLLVAAAPPHIREKVPPIVLQWLPFGVSFASLAIVGWAGPVTGAMSLVSYAFPILVFGLLLRLTQPNDPYGRWIIGAAAAAHVWPAIWFLTNVAFHFSGVGILGIVGNMLYLVALVVAAACVLFIPPLAMKPQFKAIDAFAPLFTAMLILFPVALAVLFTLQMVLNGVVLSGILMGARMLLYVISFFGVLILTAPPAYEVVKQMIAGGGPSAVNWNDPAHAAHQHAQQQAWNQQQQAQQQGWDQSQQQQQQAWNQQQGQQQGWGQQPQGQQGQQGWNQGGGQGGGWNQGGGQGGGWNQGQ